MTFPHLPTAFRTPWECTPLTILCDVLDSLHLGLRHHSSIAELGILGCHLQLLPFQEQSECNLLTVNKENTLKRQNLKMVVLTNAFLKWVSLITLIKTAAFLQDKEKTRRMQKEKGIHTLCLCSMQIPTGKPLLS